MGIHGIYKEIGPGQRIAFSKYALGHFERTGRPLRIAIDISIWLFQIQSGKGGSNPALRTFYYRLLRLISLSIHPLFVFDGPNKPPFKRNKRTGPNVASIPEFLAKQLLKQFGFPFHIAPGEAEAECALLQREGVVDAVLSEDVDTLMFGSGLTFRNWSPEYNKSGGPTHVNLYDAKITKSGSGLDREGMILIALMSGGDYIPEGIPGCGPKTACEAARAGLGAELCKISRKDKVSLNVWREKLAYELHTNESKFFKRKHGKLDIPDDFPNTEVLGYYTHPCISPSDKILRLRESLQWDQDLNLPELRTFTAEAFDWTKLGGAKKFIRNLAPALLVREMRFRGQNSETVSEEVDAIQEQEAKLVNAIHGKRNHKSTDDVTELRLSYMPHNLVPIDLDAEEPDDEMPVDSGDEALDDDVDTGDTPTSPSKRRAAPTYDPTQYEKIWVFETWAKIGIPLKVQDWEESFRNPRKYLEMKHAAKEATNAVKPKKRGGTKTTKDAMPNGALDRFTRVTKVSASRSTAGDKSKSSENAALPSRHNPFPPPAPPASQPSAFRRPPSPPTSTTPEIISLLSSPAVQLDTRQPDFPTFELPPSVTKRRRSPLRRAHTDTAILDLTGPSKHRSTTPPGLRLATIRDLTSPLPSPSQQIPAKRTKRTDAKKPQTPTKARKNTPVEFSSPARQAEITSYFSPTRRREGTVAVQHQPPSTFRRRPPSPPIEDLDLTASSPRLAKMFQRVIPREKGEEEGTLWSNRENAAQPSRPGLQELHSNLVDYQAEQRRSNPSSRASSQDQSPPSTQEAEELDLTGNLPSRTRKPQRSNAVPITVISSSPPSDASQRLPHFHRPPSLPVPTASRTTQLRKQAIRLRDSLDGAFAIEEIDLSQEVTAVGPSVRAKNVFRMSEVSVLDLTGD